MVDQPSPQLADIAALLREAEAMRARFLRLDPDPASAARHDLDAAVREVGSNEAVARVIRLADLWTLLEAEHLAGIGVLLEDGTTVFPVFPLLRAVVEHAAWVCWLLDHRVGVRERAKRAALAQLRSEEEMVGVVKRWAGSSTEQYATPKDTLTRTRVSVARDFDTFDSQGPTIDGDKVAKPTDVIEHFGGCEGDARQWVGTYAYLSGTATHPSQNAFEFVAIDDGKSHVTLNADLINRMVRIGLAAFVHSLVHLASYVGWPRDELRAYEARANEVLGADEAAP